MHTSSRRSMLTAALLAAALATSGHALPAGPLLPGPQNTATAPAAAEQPGIPYSAERLQALLPPSVYFQGHTAALQLRNAGGTSFPDGSIVWASLVDTSGYSTAVRDRYQFYFVTEGPVRFGSARIAAGVYGAGFLGDHFLLMDVGGHTVAQGPLQSDAGMRRPRPLQVVQDTPTSVRLYLGRSFVVVQTGNPK